MMTDVTFTFQRITARALAGLPGFRRSAQEAQEALIAGQPRTVIEALKIPYVARKTTRHLLRLGLLTDPEGMQTRTMAQVEREQRRALRRSARCSPTRIRWGSDVAHPKGGPR